MSIHKYQDVLKLLDLFERAKTDRRLLQPTIAEINFSLHFINADRALHHNCTNLVPYLTETNLWEVEEIIRRCTNENTRQ